VQIDRALEWRPGDSTLKARKAHALSKSGQFGKGLALYEEILRSKPEDSAILSNIGSMYRSIGRFDEAEAALEKAHRLSPSRVELYSNYLLAMHYNPAHSAEAIAQAHLKWDALFRPKTVERMHAQDRTPDRRLRIGMISAGFRIHPVGQMITSSMETLPRNEFELFAYTMSDQVDALTERMQRRADRWQSATHLDNGELAQRIRDDRIDILFDLCGHTEGNRLLAVAMEPAPLQIKWVGGQINTTGLSAIDYLLSDAVETPDGVDAQYSEKLIRLPDDYICYMPRGDAPETGTLPAYKNGFITFACFNNPAKINPIIIERWASILNKIPTSRLFLKGSQYDSAEFVGRTSDEFARHGIDPLRLIFEGHSPHHHLLNTYNRVDIALDPWPYSGGLTTCEALLMGVPVITLPGPTFAGRHSATHLINAGLPELVVDNWERYEQLAIDLASNLENLSTIRRNLRRQLENSPVCDHRRFARNFSIAMRAVWQRYCEGKAPAALRIDQKGQAWFEGDEQPMQLQFPQGTAETRKSHSFKFNFEGKIITLDHGSLLITDKGFTNLQALGAFAAIVFDPASKVTNAAQLQAAGELHHYPHVSLGNGGEGTLYACLDPVMSGTLEPLPADQQLPGNQEATQVIAKLPITTLRLDDIEGLDNIDWLLLDNMNDSLTILENGAKVLAETLLVQVRVNFSPTHKRQPELTQISHWLARHGFSFYRLNNLQHYGHLPERDDLLKQQATQLVSADAIFIPSSYRLEHLEPQKKAKLAFILHAVYQMHDLAFSLIAQNDTGEGEKYLEDNRYLSKSNPPFGSKQPHRVYINHGHPKACVGVPVYNEEKYIQETILSLKKQDVDGVKFVIYDNASSDHTYEMTRELSSDDARFELIKNPQNLGSADNFFKLFKETASDYFMWLGGHDCLSENYLQDVMAILDQSSHISMACGLPFGIVDEKIFGPVKEALYDFSQESPLERYIKSVAELTNCTIFHSMFRRVALEGFEFRKTVSADHVIISRLLWSGKLEYAANSQYLRRYFKSRDTTTEERLIGGKGKLERSEFFDYYKYDINHVLNKEACPKKQAMDIIGKVDRILKVRFSENYS